ncbi:vitellogenin receptor-like [Venturia canescens]|uniref:vitellogenin receptor-like n=1 Tax=Venturia canescens TaxID=32260 RepID=UPI001C9BDEBD|nr:vitellogenin receptor-like [Venturia canescens]
MSFLQYTISLWTCFLVIARIEASVCDGKWSIIYSLEDEIRQHCFEANYDIQITKKFSGRPARVAVAAFTKTVYWLNIEANKKRIMKTDGYSNIVIIDDGLVTPEELAVDFVTRNIYFMDVSEKYMGVCTEDGSYCTKILNSTTDTPGGLVLNPKKGEMFWSDYGQNPAIWQAGMDGSEEKTILTENLGCPKGLTIDYSTERLYWIDSKLKTVESMDLNGNDRQRLLQTKDKRLHSLAIFKDQLYWSDWSTNIIESIDLATGGDRTIIVDATKLIYDMKVYDPEFESTLPNPCENANCSQICLLAPEDRYRCACKLDYELNSSDLHTCSPKNEAPHLVIAADDKIIHYYEGIVGKARIKKIPMPIHISRIAYNWKTGNLVADDKFTSFLYSIEPESNEIGRLTPVNSKYFSGIDINSKDNEIFSVVPGPREVHQFAQGTTRIYSFPYEPYEILCIPGFDKFFVVFKTGISQFRIDLISHSDDPYKSITVIPKILSGGKISLAYDENSSTLYFAEETSGRIESFSVRKIVCDLTFDRRVLGSNVGNPVSLAVLNGKLYWTNGNSNVLNWIDLDDYNREIKSTKLPISSSFRILDIASVGNTTHRILSC